MARISAEEKETATLVPLDRILSGEDDTESAFNDFRASFDTGEEPGVVRAWELVLDERGNVGTAKMQNRLGSWPIDAYTFDELCQMLIDQYMTPEQSRMAVRLTGTRKEQTGYVFNKIVMLKRSLKKESSSPKGDNTASIMKMMQEMNERNMQMFQRMQQPVEKPDASAELQKLLAMSAALNNPMMQMLSALLPALAGRPVAPAAAAADPFASVGSLLDVAERLSDMRGGGGGGGGDGDDNSFAGILRAITPLAKPALEALPAIASMQAASRPAPRVIPAPARPLAPVAQVPPPTAPTVPAPTPAPTQSLTDLPTGDSNMLAQLKPQIDSLVEMAAQGSDATGCADLIFDQVFSDPNLPDDLYEKLANFIDSPQFVTYVTLINQTAKAHAAWFEAFKAQIIKRLDDAGVDEEVKVQPVVNI
jgi:hypothetical protein